MPDNGLQKTVAKGLFQTLKDGGQGLVALVALLMVLAVVFIAYHGINAIKYVALEWSASQQATAIAQLETMAAEQAMQRETQKDISHRFLIMLDKTLSRNTKEIHEMRAEIRNLRGHVESLERSRPYHSGEP